jgi:uncharacterized protein YfaS (alpha-2-macroglobulin family)
VTVERGKIHYQDVVRLTSNSSVYKLPVSAAMAPNAFISVLVIKGIDETNPRPNLLASSNRRIDLNRKPP